MILLVLLALVILALVIRSAMEKAPEGDVLAVLRLALTGILILVLTYVAMRIVPPETVPDFLNRALKALKG
ncbi:hypothetical protein [Streptomyces sp. NBC_00576]|uniref:hypothetical protein n=1 Tax=Streptomyces sp. NBC_00576 TaxID=2903665 RepID=UPI002E7FB542|nr:hypothetical protein [Streptomyces sp. NBC_00576]WUB73227.1 hypothetical protein OG734_25855 [Streptomyces sp. NBC_00576]